MFDKIWSYFSHDLGIDLGTANTLVYVRGKGVIVNEPSVVAINKNTKQVLAIGEDARRMVGRTPSHIVAVRPLVDGVVSDFEVTEQMLKHFISRVHEKKFSIIPRPRVVIGIPYGVTEVEQRAVEEAALNAGARQVFLIEEPVAAAIGSKLPIQEASGSMIVDIGGGTTEVAVLSLGAIVASRSLRIAGNEIDESIKEYVRDKLNLLIGDRMTESIKIKMGSVIPYKEEIEMPIRGRDLVSGLPKEIIVTDEDIREAIQKPIKQIVEAVKTTLEETPPELVADIMHQGIMLAGGGALLRGFDKLIADVTKTKVNIADDPITSMVRGTGVVLEDLDNLKDVLLSTELKK
jgi:rod shape-determining protein MreB